MLTPSFWACGRAETEEAPAMARVRIFQSIVGDFAWERDWVIVAGEAG